MGCRTYLQGINDVQIETRPDGATASIISEVAAKLGGDRITFDLDRATAGESFVWIDGRPVSLSAGNGWDSEFQLPNGGTLDPQIPTSEIDSVFADAWEVTDASSLFDPRPADVPEPADLDHSRHWSRRTEHNAVSREA